MTAATAHPLWCDTTVCEVSLGGAHRSEATTVYLRRGRAPRLLLMLSQPERGAVMIRMVVIGDMVINELTVSIDEAHLAAAALLKSIKARGAAGR